MKVEIPATCGNAPRHQIITDVITAVHNKDISVLEQWFSEDIQWEIIGSATLVGVDSVREWILATPTTDTLQFFSVLTHGKEGSTDGQSYNQQQSVTHFSHVLKFASAGKAAKIKEIRSYFV
ncbi:hypothetical protein [Arthrobacter sp. NIO-1057]|uniref:hypothetical protein n=1 Tax=Arthrobacter sp. NIO-1057 TaxID=993071 RepID=UPI00071DDA64|nr:hypothetical protein [Arthrobacter sp. NIO-1057]KSU66194.1 hypothetical protein AS038_11065 [Arthrobacter sp. NIO-1057]SCC34428.1 Ketosteroid isomerase-related protein [Arthrobacter sp. NIO-1057]